jgi:O-antigen/teichoic acid export membrane protein/serine acetyltransferase
VSGASSGIPVGAADGSTGVQEVVEPPSDARSDDGASVSRAVKLNLVMSITLQLLNVVSGLELARGLGVTGRGELAAAILWPTVIGAIATLGLQESMTYHVARNPKNAGRLLGSALGLWAIQSLVFSAITAAVVPLALHKHTGTVITAGLIYTCYVSLNMYGLVLVGTVNGLHRYGLYNAGITSIGISIVTLQTVLLAVGAFHVETIVIGMMGCYVACMVFATWLAKRAHPGRLQFDRRTMRSIFAYGVRSNTSTTSSFLNQRLDQLVISAFLSAHQLGIYVVAITFTLFAPLLGGSIALAALPNVARLDDPGERNLLSRRMVSFTLIASAIVSLPIVIFAPQLISLFFGHAYSVGGNITRVTAIASVSFAVTRSLEAVLRGIGRPLAAGMAEFVALGATAACLAALLPTLGLIGAAWASLIAYTVSGVWMAWRIRKLTGLPILQLLTPDREGLIEARDRFRSFRRRRSEKPADEPPAGRAEHGRRTRHAAALRDPARQRPMRRPADTSERDAFFGGPLAPAGSKPATNLTPVADATETTEPARDTRGTVRGLPFDEAKAIDGLPEQRFTTWELIWSDYLAQYYRKVESQRARRLLFLPRVLTNSCLHATILVRLQLGTPIILTFFWRRLLIALHGIDIQPYTRIGPGLRMPHPIGILVGPAVLGRDVVLQHHVTISPVTTRWRTGKSPGFVQVGDGVTFFTGTVVAGPVAIGDGSMIGANSLIVRDVPAGHMVIAGRPRPATQEELSGF